MGKKSGEEICLFVRDEQTGRFLFNAKALQALGINPVEALQRGYPTKEQSALAEAAGDPPRISRHIWVLLRCLQISLDAVGLPKPPSSSPTQEIIHRQPLRPAV